MDYLNSIQGPGAYALEQYADKVPARQPIRAELERQAQVLRLELQRIEEMQALIMDNPVIEKFINLQRGYIG